MLSQRGERAEFISDHTDQNHHLHLRARSTNLTKLPHAKIDEVMSLLKKYFDDGSSPVKKIVMDMRKINKSDVQATITLLHRVGSFGVNNKTPVRWRFTDSSEIYKQFLSYRATLKTQSRFGQKWR